MVRKCLASWKPFDHIPYALPATFWTLILSPFEKGTCGHFGRSRQARLQVADQLAPHLAQKGCSDHRYPHLFGMLVLVAGA
jgi:hypothetical protein